MQDIKALIAQARLPEKTEDICLRGDLAAEHDALEQQLDDLPESNSLSGDPERRRITAEMAALAEQMRAATVRFRLRAMPARQYQQLEAQHPPRRLDEQRVDRIDWAMGFNRTTMFEPLIRACLVEPVLDDDDFAALLDALSEVQFSKLAGAALALNKREIDVPFSPAASPTTPGSEPK